MRNIESGRFRDQAVAYGVVVGHEVTSVQCNASPTLEAQKYEEHEREVLSAIKDVQEHSDSRIKDVASHYGIARNTLTTRVQERMHGAREAHVAQMLHSPVKENALGLSLKHREL
ncbi:hypothetical protein FN846DRAFT_894244 [Sphaerosporella brunnea]|uniref:Uncharacterized protein n=1 Tax=Sphaerosporella brunnea TaxID=1250544 RepID=A0A5J5EI16_9PEZI|nr:hypothetical protein FN846DRAFT_894244 [Sphaerosporella brunnea]